MNVMNMRALLMAISIFLSSTVSGAQAVDEAKPYGRACVTVGDTGTKTVALFTAETPPGPDRFLIVHLDANSPCEALVAAFTTKDGKLAFGWRPEMLALAEWEEKAVGQQRWLLNQPMEAFEVFVLYFVPGSA